MEHRNYEELMAERARYPLGKPTPYRPGHKNHLEDNTPVEMRGTYHGPMRPRWLSYRTAWGTFAMIFILGGIFLLIYFGNLFVFHYSEPYRNVVILLTAVLAPFIYYRLGRAPIAATLANNYPTAWIRKAILLPSMAVIMVVLPLIAPLGWLFAGVAWSSGTMQRVPAVAVEVRSYVNKRRGCSQYATLRLLSVEKKTCLDYHYPRLAMRPGQYLMASVRTVPFGFLILLIADASPVAQDS